MPTFKVPYPRLFTFNKIVYKVNSLEEQNAIVEKYNKEKADAAATKAAEKAHAKAQKTSDISYQRFLKRQAKRKGPES